MDVRSAILKRRTIRRFQPTPIADEILQELVELGRYYASGANLQPIRFAIISRKPMTDQVFAQLKWAAYLPDFEIRADQKPAAYIVFLRDDDVKKNAQYDLGAASTTVMLAAEARGLSTCALGSFHAGKLTQLLGLAENLKPELVLALGYADQESEAVDYTGDVKYYEEDGGLRVPKLTMDQVTVYRDTVQYQAHRGVCTECPENTFSAFRKAVEQGYELIELDLKCTADEQFVVLHDWKLNRTARYPDGRPLDEERRITELTYEEAAAFDYGLWFSEEFRGEKLPLFKDLFPFFRESGVRIKIDNCFRSFPEPMIEKLFDLMDSSGVNFGFTCYDMDMARRVAARFPDRELHYDGAVTPEILEELGQLKKKDQLIVWLPYPCSRTSWVKVGLVTEELSALVRKYARLGIWILGEYEEDSDAVKRFHADIIETTGGIKPLYSR